MEKWVTGERAEINQKRSKVKDTVSEIGVFMKKIEQDKQLQIHRPLNEQDLILLRFRFSLRCKFHYKKII